MNEKMKMSTMQTLVITLSFIHSVSPVRWKIHSREQPRVLEVPGTDGLMYLFQTVKVPLKLL